MTVWRLGAVDLAIDPAPLPYDHKNRAKIAAAWARSKAANGALYDGEVYLVGRWSVTGTRLVGTCHKTRFSTVLHLRDHWTEASRTWNAFGSAILRGSDGGFVLGEMAAHTANPGKVYFPGGILDPQDSVGGYLDPTACIQRELLEETGLRASDLTLANDFVVAHHRHALGIGRVLTSPLTATDLVARLRGALQSQAKPELTDFHVVYDPSAADHHAVPEFTRMMIRATL